jgi:hypothetical protein
MRPFFPFQYDPRHPTGRLARFTVRPSTEPSLQRLMDLIYRRESPSGKEARFNELQAAIPITERMKTCINETKINRFDFIILSSLLKLHFP